MSVGDTHDTAADALRSSSSSYHGRSGCSDGRAAAAKSRDYYDAETCETVSKLFARGRRSRQSPKTRTTNAALIGVRAERGVQRGMPLVDSPNVQLSNERRRSLSVFGYGNSLVEPPFPLPRSSPCYTSGSARCEPVSEVGS